MHVGPRDLFQKKKKGVGGVDREAGGEPSGVILPLPRQSQCPRFNEHGEKCWRGPDADIKTCGVYKTLVLLGK